VLKTETTVHTRAGASAQPACKMVVIWIDWYAYHLARFEALLGRSDLAQVIGIELVGGVGVHAGLKFKEKIPQGLPVETLLPESNWQDAKGLKLVSALWEKLNRLDPAVVLVPGYYTAPGFAAALWSKWKRRRTVLMTESTEHDHARVWWKEKCKGLLVRTLFDSAVAGGLAHRRYLERLGFPAGRIARFYDVVDNRFFRDNTQALRNCYQARDFDLPEQYFLYVGRLAEEKNIHGLLAAYLDYRRSGGAWSLVLVGDGPQRKQLQEAAASSAFAADVHFPGLKGTAELPQYYAFANCFVLPSTREPWGLVTNEAMASGLPVIVSERCGCVEDLVTGGDNGFSFDPAKPGDLLHCLTALGNLSPQALRRMGECSSEIVSRFSPEAWAAEVARVANS
jgi:1,2-diacylglycerol 3-alpha-glucosyltransferase